MTVVVVGQVARDLVRQVRTQHTARLAAYEGELAELAGDPAARDPRRPAFASRNCPIRSESTDASRESEWLAAVVSSTMAAFCWVTWSI